MLVQLIGSGLSPREIAYYAIIILFAMTLSFSVHEFMHAAVATWLGDPTPKNMGRVTINPVAHIDLMGAALLLICGFGWGKPVMYNPSNLHRFNNRRVMNIMVHLAGVTGNFIVALLSKMLVYLFEALTQFGGNTGVIIFSALASLFGYTYMFSIMLLAFNLLPIPPLDGFHVLEELLPYKFKCTNGYRNFERIAPGIIWIVVLADRFTRLNILGTVIGLIEWPFERLIGLITNPVFMLCQMIG